MEIPTKEQINYIIELLGDKVWDIEANMAKYGHMDYQERMDDFKWALHEALKPSNEDL